MTSPTHIRRPLSSFTYCGRRGKTAPAAEATCTQCRLALEIARRRHWPKRRGPQK